MCRGAFHAPAFGAECAKSDDSDDGDGGFGLFGDEGMLPVADCERP